VLTMNAHGLGSPVSLSFVICLPCTVCPPGVRGRALTHCINGLSSDQLQLILECLVLEWDCQKNLKGYLLFCGFFCGFLFVSLFEGFEVVFLKSISISSGINMVPDAVSTLAFLTCMIWCYKSSKK